MGGAYGGRYMMGGFSPFGLFTLLLWGALLGALGGYVMAWTYNKA